MSATSYGPCPTCGKPHPAAPYSCRACIEALPDPFDDDLEIEREVKLDWEASDER